MDSAQSVNQSIDVSFLPRSTSGEVHCDDLEAHVQPSLISNGVVCFPNPHVECVPAVLAECAIEAGQNSAKEEQKLLEIRSLDKSVVDYRQASDEQLLAAARASDEGAFEELSSRCKDSLRNRVFRIVRNREDTEDVVQEALLKAYKHLGEFRGSSSFSTWLTRIAINSALMILRKRKLRSEVPLDQQGSEEQKWEVWDFPDPSLNPELTYAKRQVLELMSRAINRLPPSYRNVLELCHRQEQSLHECADEVGITVAAAKSRLLRARLTIRSSLEKRGVFAADACR